MDKSIDEELIEKYYGLNFTNKFKAIMTCEDEVNGYDSFDDMRETIEKEPSKKDCKRKNKYYKAEFAHIKAQVDSNKPVTKADKK